MNTLSQYQVKRAAVVEERLNETNAGWDNSVVQMMPPLASLGSYAFLGSWSWTMPAEHKRLLLASAARVIGNQYVSPSAATRAYLETKYTDKLRMCGPQAREITIPRSHPLYAVPSVLDHGVYLDLKSAFWSIVRVVGWDCDYSPGKWLGVRSSVEDYPYPDWKHARNCLVSLARPSTINVWRDGKIHNQVKRNPHVNHSLVALVFDVLHGIAADMIEAGALYVHTDGYIFDRARLEDGIAILASWGLPSAIKSEGKMEVITTGVYSTPEHKPKGHLALAQSRSMNSVYPVDRAWLRKRMRFFSRF